jgi:hypothetical protein
MNKQVYEYIEKQMSPQKELCLQLRSIIFGVFPGIEEEMKWGVPTYAKGKFYFVALKDHFEGSGKTMKILKFSSIQEIDETKIVNLLRLVWGRQESKTK